MEYETRVRSLDQQGIERERAGTSLDVTVLDMINPYHQRCRVCPFIRFRSGHDGSHTEEAGLSQHEAASLAFRMGLKIKLPIRAAATALSLGTE